ncbi:2-C-methyl-D-erythritol 4-phosphate cytidylyltransferase [Macellibacteroides sp. HH-ZS]|nr:2-C-methyl-D-erythritol 4-phosphate cytidylyltransferase [Macellibacteroides sp. HH-ZS]
MNELPKYVLIVAGGKGLRMGEQLPKQFIPIAGKPVLMHTLDAFVRYDASVRLIVVLPESHQPYWQDLCIEYNFSVPHQVTTGGETRFHSVRNGLKLVNSSGLVAIHDGVRPLVTTDVIAACFKAAASDKAAVPVLPMIDSLREYKANGSMPVDRTRYCSVQTPQVFDAATVLSAYDVPYDACFTDDASVVEACGYPVTLVAGNRENIKITTPFDLLIAEAVLKGRTNI